MSNRQDKIIPYCKALDKSSLSIDKASEVSNQSKNM